MKKPQIQKHILSASAAVVCELLLCISPAGGSGTRASQYIAASQGQKLAAQAAPEQEKLAAKDDTRPAEQVHKNIQVMKPQASAQEPWSWPEKPKNLLVLPKDWSGTRLRPVMIGFTRALGVRCSSCHKGEEGKPLSTYDFVSDENPNKNRAREMLRMLGDINDHLKKIQPSGDQRVNMWCHTCHHGRPRPMTLEEELGEQYRTKGIKTALDHYVELKKKFYGRNAYDFGENSLNGFGYYLLENKDADGAIQVLKLNADTFPESSNVWDSLAEAYMKAGDSKKAQENYQKSLTLDPTNENAREMLKKLKESPQK